MAGEGCRQHDRCGRGEKLGGGVAGCVSEVDSLHGWGTSSMTSLGHSRTGVEAGRCQRWLARCTASEGAEVG
jgi:hypothetical protein